MTGKNELPALCDELLGQRVRLREWRIRPATLLMDQNRRGTTYLASYQRQEGDPEEKGLEIGDVVAREVKHDNLGPYRGPRRVLLGDRVLTFMGSMTASMAEVLVPEVPPERKKHKGPERGLIGFEVRGKKRE